MSSDADLSQSPKPDAATFSFRPQRPSKKPVTTTAPTIPVSTTPTPIESEVNFFQRDANALPYIETPTNLSQLVYTREWMYIHRVSDQVEPDSATVSKMRSAQVYRTVSPGSTSTSSSREFGSSQHRERRGSAGPRNGRSGSGSFGPSSSFPNVSGAGNNGSSKSRGGSGSGAYLTSPSHRSGSQEDNSSDSSFGGRRDTPSRRIAVVGVDSSGFQRELISLLNKLTVEKFENLAQQITKKFDAVENAEVLTECVKLLHAKALREHSFCGMYADLAKQLDKVYAFETLDSVSSAPSTPPPQTTSPSPGQMITSTRVEQIRSDAMPLTGSNSDRSISPARPRSDSSNAKPRPVSMLRKVLLNNCYYVWQEGMDGKPSLMGEDETALKARQRVMGNMIFMGELYKRGLMPLKVLKSSADGLVSSIKEKIATAQFALAEPHCIMLRELLRVVGESLDNDVRVGRPLLEGYMESLKEFASHRALQARVRFLMRDVIDDRLNEWRPRRRYDGPMRLEDVKELHDADQINPTFVASERIIAPSSEFDERQKARTSVSPAKRTNDRNAKDQSRSNSTQRSGSGRRGSGSSWTTLTLPTIKEPTLVQPSSPTSTPPLAVWPKAALLEFADSLADESLEPILSYLQTQNNAATTDRRTTFLSDLVNWSLDNSEKTRKVIPKAITYFHARSAIFAQDIIASFTSLTLNLEDLRIDVPAAPAIISKFLSEITHQHKLISQEQLQSIADQCPSSCKAKFLTQP